MKSTLVKVSLLFLFMGGLLLQADAQRRSSSRRGNTGQPANQPTTTPGTQKQQSNNNNQTPAYNPYGNVPIETAPVADGLSDTVRKSMRPDDAYDKSMINDRTPLPYEHLRWDDALFSEKVWREIDLREKIGLLGFGKKTRRLARAKKVDRLRVPGFQLRYSRRHRFWLCL